MNMNKLYEKETIREVLLGASSFLKSVEKEEAAAEWLLKERFNLSKTQLIRRFPEKMPQEMKEIFVQDLAECAQGKPVQYIVGHEWFYDRKFKVTEHTLIPRPETEEWFDRYINVLPKNPMKVLDIGTGTGVLAVSHKLERSQDQVTAVDISAQALKIAEENAESLSADVEFLESDLTEAVMNRKYDLILSNPPYISKDEMQVMDQSVIDFEPAIALFAEEDGLLVYKKLAEELPLILNPKGRVVLEIGYLQGQKVKSLFEKVFPEAVVEIWKDLSNQDRVIVVTT